MNLMPNYLDFFLLFAKQYKTKISSKKISNSNFPSIKDFNCSLIINKSKDHVKIKRGKKKFRRIYIFYFINNLKRNNSNIKKISCDNFLNIFLKYTLNSKTSYVFSEPIKMYKKKFEFYSYKKSILKFFYLKKKNKALMENIITEKKFRKKGFSKYLIRNVIKKTNKKCIVYLVCEKRLINFYKRIGFKLLKTKIYKNF